MWKVCTVTQPVARKEYNCEASDWIDNTIGWDESEFEPQDVETIRKARAERFKILPGTKYVKVSGFWDGDTSVFRARIDLDDICKRYDLYQE